MPANLKTRQWTRKGQFSFQSQRKAMTKNVQITIQLHSFHMLARLCSISFKLCFNNTKTENFEMYKLDLERQRNQRSYCQHLLYHQKSKRFPEKKTSTSASLTKLKPLTVWISANWKDWCWSWSSNTLATWWEEPTHWKSCWCWERLREGWEGGDRGWDGWMAPLSQWTWIWANSGS